MSESRSHSIPKKTYGLAKNGRAHIFLCIIASLRSWGSRHLSVNARTINSYMWLSWLNWFNIPNWYRRFEFDIQGRSIKVGVLLRQGCELLLATFARFLCLFCTVKKNRLYTIATPIPHSYIEEPVAPKAAASKPALWDELTLKSVVFVSTLRTVPPLVAGKEWI